ncbi:MAG: ATP-binding protein [Trueperaceae bacterium]
MTPDASGSVLPDADRDALARRLRGIEVFSDLAAEDRAWLAEHAKVVELEAGEALFHRGDPAAWMFSVLDGEMRSRREDGVSDGRLYVRRTGQTGGVLPRSRLSESPLTVRAAVRSTVVCFARADFPAMLERIPVLEQRLASLMADRVRETAQFDQHRERLSGLGKLAAGLAHELNNPVAAIQRLSDELRGKVASLETIGRELLDGVVGADALARIESLGSDDGSTDGSAHDAGRAPLDRLARGDAEDEVAEALGRLGVPEAWALAEGLVANGVRADDLEHAVAGLEPDAAAWALRWLEAARSTASLHRELAAASERIVGLVSSVKGFSQLDRARTKGDLDVREGLRDTLAVVAHAIRDRRITLREDHALELPNVLGVASELNQVWLNLVDNAIDAAGEGGSVTLRTRANQTEVLVDVEDDGPGIPSDIVWRIFEPFFTTKPVGEGTGLGLELVRRVVIEHGGDVSVESVPGRTAFRVRLPAAGA